MTTEKDLEKVLLSILKGLPQDAVGRVMKRAVSDAGKERVKAEAQSKIDALREQIATAVAPAVAQVKADFDIRVRNGVVDVHLVGVKQSSGGATANTPISKDTGMSMRQLVEGYLPGKLDEFDTADSKTGSGRGKRTNLALAARKIWLADQAK